MHLKTSKLTYSLEDIFNVFRFYSAKNWNHLPQIYIFVINICELGSTSEFLVGFAFNLSLPTVSNIFAFCQDQVSTGLSFSPRVQAQCLLLFVLVSIIKA